MQSEKLDPRLNAFRPDLADERLKGRVEAARFVAGTPAQVVQAIAPMRSAPGVEKGLVNEALHGEQLRVFDWGGDGGRGWAFVQLERDGYVGYMPAQALGTEIATTTHRVSSLGTWVYAAPDIKAPAVMHLSLGCEVAVRRIDERFAEIDGGRFIVSRHLSEKSRHSRDFVEAAERFIGTPYLWGGRSRLGLDCSGLVQLALESAGMPSPRDSDMQQDVLGANVLIPADLEGLDRGDLVFWPGHVGIMSDGVMLLHANAHHMAVVAEPLEIAVARIRKSGSEIRAIKRLERYRIQG